MPKKIIEKPKKSVLQELYETQHLNHRQIGTIYGVSARSVGKWMHSDGIVPRPSGVGLIAQGKQSLSREELEPLVCEQHLNYKEIGAMFGVTVQAVHYWVKVYDLPRPEYYQSHHTEKPILPTTEEFLQLYEGQKMPLHMIAKQYGITRDILTYFCKKQGIALRHDGFNGGHRFTCRDGHIVRSVYEQRVDDWLFEHNIEHVIEPLLPFDRRYRADFLANGWYIEIWGIRTNKAYVQRRLQKTSQYKEHGLPLLEIHEHHFDGRRNEPWARRLHIVLKAPLD